MSILFYKNINLCFSYKKSLSYIQKTINKSTLYSQSKFIYTYLRALHFHILKNKTLKGDFDLPQNKIVVRANSTFQIHFWLKTLQLFKNEEVLIWIDSNRKDEQIIKLCEDLEFDYLFSSLNNFYKPEKLKQVASINKTFFKLLFSRKSVHSYSNILHFYSDSIIKTNCIDNFLNKLKAKAILVLADEVNPYSHIFNQIAKFHNIKVINSMNGIKNKTERNSDTNFDAWLIWSKAQYDMLTNFNKTPKEQLHIVGHLYADVIYDYKSKNHNSFIIDKSIYKKVFAIFSQPYVGGHEENRDTFLKEMSTFFTNNPQYLAIVKPHPRESREGIAKLLDLSLPNIIFVEESDKEILYSIINQSDYIITMFSTVSIEGLFFDKPVFSFRLKKLPDLLEISPNLIPRFENSKELEYLISTPQDNNQNENIEYELGYIDGNNHKRAFETVEHILKNNINIS